MKPDTRPDFTLRLRLYNPVHDRRLVVVRAWVTGHDGHGRTRYTCEVVHGQELIFPYGQLTCAAHTKFETGLHAREAVLDLVAMKPGDTDADYFADYSPKQREWTSKYGEAILCEAHDRYCDPDDGSPYEDREL
jgi:hypothetical protein